MLIRGFNDELLPKRLSMRRNVNTWKDWYHHNARYRGEEVWKIYERIIENNIGKSYDKALKYFRRRVSKSLYYLFKENFKKEHERITWRWKHYYVDKGIIRQFIPKKPNKPIVITSSDYEEKIVFKGNHAIYLKNHLYLERREEIVVISGWKKEYETKKHPEYIRLSKERHKRRLREAKYDRKYRYYEWFALGRRTKEEMEIHVNSFSIHKGKNRTDKRREKEILRREKELETKTHAFQTMERKGFDAENSFRH